MERLTEQILFAGAEFVEADGAARVIKNVALLGPVSKNGRRYTAEAMAKAQGQYSGVQCFINHPTKEETQTGRRDVRNIAGVIENARMDGDKIKGDVKLLPDIAGQKFWDIASTMPHAASCSHVAMGNSVRRGNEVVVEEITKVLSVDLVANGATTDSVFEGQEQEHDMDLKDVTIEGLRTGRPELTQALLDEGAKTRDTEVKTLTEEKTALAAKVDEFTVKEAVAVKKAAVAKMLTEAKLPAAAVTETFTQQLEACEDEATAKALIEDRRKLAGGVKNMGATNPPGGGAKPTSPRAIAESNMPG